MTTWVALLRGINVGGHHRLAMRDLAALLGDLGARDVRTSIQSGNAVFEVDGGDDPDSARHLAARITRSIDDRHGFAPRVMLLSSDALRRAIAGNPFPAAEREPTTLHVFFLDAAPAAPDLAGLEAVRAPSEHVAIDGAILYLHLPEGLGRSKLALKAERLVGVPATARNWATVTRLGELVATAREP